MHNNQGAPGRCRASPRQIGGLVFAFLLILYVVTAKGFSEMGDAETYYVITESIVERGWVDIPPGAGLTDKVHNPRGIMKGRDGRTYSQYWLGYPLFQVPWYVAGKWVGQIVAGISPRWEALARFGPRVAINLAGAFVTAATAAALFGLLVTLGLHQSYSAATAVVYGLATYAWPYAKIGFYEPFLALTLLVAVLMLLWFDRRQSMGYILVFAFVLGWGTATRPSLILAWPPLLVYLLVILYRRTGQGKANWKHWLLAAGTVIVGMAPWLAVSLWYNALRTGSAVAPGYSPGNYMPTTALAHLATAVFGNTFSTGRGFFVYSPIALLMFWGIRPLWRKCRPQSILIWSLVLLNFIFFCARPGWYTIWPWGPRYLVVLAPLVMVAVGFGLARLWPRRVGRGIIVALIAISVLVQLLAIVVPYGTYLHYVEDTTGTWRTPISDPRYFPILGQVHTLQRVRFDRVPPAALSGGYVAQEVKTNIRHSLDFWWIYAYRLGVPPVVWAPLVAVLLAAAVMIGWRLRRLVRLPAPEQQRLEIPAG